MGVININTDALIKFALKLEKLHKSALPSAIRGTLNDAAFDVKTNTMPKQADADFKKRQPNFFKVNSKFDKAVGFNVNSMRSTVGFFENKLQNASTNYAVKDLEQQEQGGAIKGKSFVPLDTARSSNSRNKNVRQNARIGTIKNLINAKKSTGKNWAQKAIKAAVFAGKDGIVLNPGRKGSVVWRITSLKRINGNIRFKKLKLYSFNKNRVVKVHSTHFMKNASLKTGNNLDSFYIKQAQRQIQKYLK